jgi:uncharacterized membrane protein YfcA
MEDDIMHSTAVAAGTLCVLFFSTLTRSTLGFGDALIAMPFLAMLLGIQTAAPLVALVSTLISLMILVRNWHIVDFHMTWRLIVAAACGVPVGLFYLTRVPESLTQMLLGFLLIGFCLYNLRRSSGAQMRVSPHAAYAFGFAAGALGGAYNTVGPMLVMYGHLRGWPPEQFRATLQSCFFPAYGSIVIGHSLTGLITPQIMQYFVLSLPLICLAIYLGGRLHTSIPQARFARYINMALLLIGVVLCVRGYTAAPAAKVRSKALRSATEQCTKNAYETDDVPPVLALSRPHAISCVSTGLDFVMAQGEHDAAGSTKCPKIVLHTPLSHHPHSLFGWGANTVYLYQQHWHRICAHSSRDLRNGFGQWRQRRKSHAQGNNQQTVLYG